MEKHIFDKKLLETHYKNGSMLSGHVSHKGIPGVELSTGSGSEKYFRAVQNGAAELYHNNVKRLETTSVGVSIPQDLHVDGHTELDNVNIAGVVTATTFKGALQGTSGTFSSGVDITGDLDVDGHTDLDNVSIAGVSTATGGSVFGNIQAGVGALNATIQKTDNGTLHLQYNKPGNLELCQGGGQVQVKNNFHVAGLSTMTGGAKLGNLSVGYDGLNVTIQPLSGQNTLHFNYNNGTEVRIGEGQTRSDLIVKGDIEPKTDSAFDLGTTSVRWRTGYFDTVSAGSSVAVGTGVTIESNGQATYTGIVTAQKFVGDGSGLTGITASGSGVVIKHDGSTVGTAGTINFSTNLDVSAISAGIVTVTASGGGSYGNNDVDNHLNVSSASSGQILSWNGSDYAWVADQTGSGSSDSISEGNSKAEVSDTGTNGRFFVETEGSERFSIDSTGDFLFNSCNDSVFNSTGNLTLDYKINNSTKARWIVGGSDLKVYLQGGDDYPFNIWSGDATKDIKFFKSGDVTVGTAIKMNGPSGIVTATSFVGDGSNLTGIDAGVGITTNLSGSFTASAGSPSTINTFGYGSGDIVVEYTVFIKNGSDFQSQKLLAMRDGTTIHSTQFAVMYSSSLLVQLDATISSGNILLRATPETGVSGSTTYKIKREVM